MLGVILLAMGIFVAGARAPLTDANVNLYCGLFMVVFGAFLLVMAWRGPRIMSAVMIGEASAGITDRPKACASFARPAAST